MPVDHYENFPVASLLLPKHLRRPIEAIYRFARTADDIADEGNAPLEERQAALQAYRAELDRIAGREPTQTGLFTTLAEVIQNWNLPLQAFYDLLDAFQQDLTQTRYASYEELLAYCQRSANPIGHLVLHLTQSANDKNKIHADAICSALQLINFWQDIAVDWKKNRVYLPQEDLHYFNIDETQIAESHWDVNWENLMDFQITRTQQLMQQGLPLIHSLSGRIAWEIRLTIQGGLRILEKIREQRGNIFQQRPTLRQWDWLGILFKTITL